MRFVGRSLISAVLLVVLPISILGARAFAASPANANRVVLHSPIHAMGFQRVMAVARLRHTTHDIVINFHAERLPSPHVLREMAYVLWAVNGSHEENVGVLQVHNMMSSLMTQTMMHTFQDLIVTAERSPSVAAPHGTIVLSGMVG